jgi:hypothetical protein
MTKLLPGDVLVFQDTAKGWYGKLQRWLLGSTQGRSWGHVSLYCGNNEQIESIGRGVCQTKITPGRFTAVLRYKNWTPFIGTLLVENARLIRDQGGSWYDYWSIPRFVIPRLVFNKLTGGRFGFGWKRNCYFICSEFAEEVYLKSNCQLWDNLNVPPLPDDYFYTDKLKLITFTRFYKNGIT